MSSLETFVRSPQFAECLASLQHRAPLSVPVEGDFAEQLSRYAAQRAAAVTMLERSRASRAATMSLCVIGLAWPPERPRVR
jgi:hypothetical protein